MKFSSIEQSTRNLLEMRNASLLGIFDVRPAAGAVIILGGSAVALSFLLRYMWLACDVRWH